jgi:two-component system, NtrC family, sensor histidine kinase HydH
MGVPASHVLPEADRFMSSQQPSADKVKPFRLVKYFTFTSLIVIFLGTVVLSIFNTHWARAMQMKKSEDYALLLVENLNHQVFLQFIIPVALKFGKIQLRNKEQFERMDKVVRSTLHSFRVDMVNIYDMNHIISYSFDQDKVGRKDKGGSGYQSAVSGKATSKLVQQGNFIEIFLGIPRESRIITFAPLRAEKPLSRISGPVLGVVEIAQDLSADYHAIFRFQIRVILTSSMVMGALFVVLLLVVRRGERIIHQRNLERIRLEEELGRTRRLSAIGEMVAGISHEIRNPLGIIRSSAELLKKQMARYQPQSRIPEVIVEESTRLNRIITDFLDFARPKQPTLSPCRLEAIVEKNLTFLSSQETEVPYTFDRRIDEGLPDIRADADMLYQAFLNVLINAMQAMPGGGRIGVAIRANGSHVAARFTDDGGGIPAEVFDKLWDPFFTTKDTGTGLGLGIVKNIVESHGGTVTIANRPAGGAEVTVRLPAAGS